MPRKPDPAAAHATLADPRWQRVLARDAAADGAFVYAVRSTGVYCRPSCPSRTARPENVRFFDDAGAARAAGFRACKRCQPDAASAGAHAERIAGLCRLIEASETPPTLAELARHAGLSPHHLQRVFKATTGVSPREYAAAHRGERVRNALANGAPVTDALYDAGYQSAARFYAEAQAVLGMPPARYRAKGAGETIRFALGECSLGSILVAASARGVCAIALGDAPEALLHDLQTRFDKAELIGADADFETLVARVVALIETPGTAAELPLDIRGTAFQQRVWQALRAIPPGTTLSYTELAQRLGAPRAVRAVAAACAANTLAVAIPCHRVVRSDGALAGYRWGIARKAQLLARERGTHAAEARAPAGSKSQRR